MAEGDELDVFVTKYALTKGIEITHVKDCGDGYAKAVGNCFSWLSKTEWHTDYSSARVRAEQMREKKIASLRKELSKLEALQFPEEEPQS